MAKRFADSEKWKKNFFSNLSMQGKLVWIYLLDNCDNTGIWSINYKLLSFQVGFNVEQSDIVEWFSSKIAFIENDKILIKPFIEFQYGKLNESNNAHKPVLKLIEKIGPIEDLMSPSLGAQDKDKDKAKAKALDKVMDQVLVMDQDKDKDFSKKIKKPKHLKTESDIENKKLRDEIWASYSKSYVDKYRVEPTRNVSVNSKIKQLADRLGNDAPDVVSFYLTHNDSLYLKSLHSIGPCLSHAEALHTQWKRGRAITSNDISRFQKVSAAVEMVNEAKKGGF